MTYILKDHQKAMLHHLTENPRFLLLQLDGLCQIGYDMTMYPNER